MKNFLLTNKITLKFLNTITDIGDSAVMGAIVIIGVLFFTWKNSNKAAQSLLLSLVLAASGIALVKMFFIGCGIAGIHSPSGHAALSLAVLGTYANLFATQLDKHQKRTPFIILFTVAFAIAATRVILGFHTIPEVAIGLAIGFIAYLLVKGFLSKGSFIPDFDILKLVLAIAFVAILFNGFRLPAEEYIALIAKQFKPVAGVCD